MTLSITPNHPTGGDGKVRANLYSFGGYTNCYGNKLVDQYNNDEIVLRKAGQFNINYYYKHACALLLIWPENIANDEQILIVLRLYTYLSNRVRIFVGAELVRDESNLQGEENIAILTDIANYITIHIAPMQTARLLAFRGADITVI